MRLSEQQPAEVNPPSSPVSPPSEPMAELTEVYFDFDQYTLRSEARTGLKAAATILKAQPEDTIVIEGHCDERGTSAYNLVLGERRAQAAKRYLQDLGLAASQIQILSYGKERPFCTEHSEACWQSNRRVHFRRPSRVREDNPFQSIEWERVQRRRRANRSERDDYFAVFR
jgi:peptidoglycan-associated lipoprotein